MEQNIELQHVICSILRIQIQFGVYKHGDRLPTMEEACRLFKVSIRTIRAAYQNLQKEGFITISQKVGIKVKTQYNAEDAEQYVQSFFSCRRDALTDMSRSMQPLFSNAQWMGFQIASPDLLDSMEQFIQQKGIHPSNRMIQQLQQIYGSLHNDMFMRLVWQVLMFYQSPFMSLMNTSEMPEPKENPLLEMINMCREQKWTGLRTAIETFQSQMANALNQFYETRIDLPSSEQQINFYWSGYKKTSQICYTLAMELLTGIARGIYPEGSYLPSAKKLAEEKKVSVITVRRALAVLNDIGAMESVNGIGTRILPIDEITQRCDFTQPVVKKRLLDHAQSLQSLTFSCKEVAQITMTSIEPSVTEQFKERLNLLRSAQRDEMAVYSILELITHSAPYQSIRTVYTELFQQLLWGYPLRGIRKEAEILESFYRPCLNYFLDCLERSAAVGFATKLEEVLIYELNYTTGLLSKLGILSTAALPESCRFE